MSSFSAIPGITDIKKCILAIKKNLEIGLGYIGQKDSSGYFLDKFVTFRDLEKFILSSGVIASAISYSVSSAQGMNDPVDTTILSGIITVSGSGMVTISSESGTADDLDQISGLSKGETIYILANSGHTITINAGTYLKLPSPTWILSGYRIATFDCIGGGICVMRTHEANRS